MKMTKKEILWLTQLKFKKISNWARFSRKEASRLKESNTRISLFLIGMTPYSALLTLIQKERETYKL